MTIQFASSSYNSFLFLAEGSDDQILSDSEKAAVDSYNSDNHKSTKDQVSKVNYCNMLETSRCDHVTYINKHRINVKLMKHYSF